MLQPDEPDDYVIGTGVMHSVRDLVVSAFSRVDLDWEEYVKVDPALIRPAEVHTLQADPRRAAAELEWTPTVSFAELIAMMVDADIERLTGS
jgi:GDPmannose 4,6-dehydratase